MIQAGPSEHALARQERRLEPRKDHFAVLGKKKKKKNAHEPE